MLLVVIKHHLNRIEYEDIGRCLKAKTLYFNQFYLYEIAVKCNGKKSKTFNVFSIRN